MKREALLARLRSTPRWDVLVIGGGATGLGCAVDAAARGYTTLLLEAHDFAKGTSSRSTKLIHGGVRYLAQGRIGLVREALEERAILLANAPHLVHPQRFVVPVYRQWDRLMLGVGLTAYDWLAGQRSLGASRLLSAADTAAALPTVKRGGLLGGIAYMDARFDDARLAVTLMRTVFDLGGLAINYLPVTALRHEAGRVAGVDAHDVESGEHFSIAARVVINAGGVWADALRQLDDLQAPAQLAPSQGAHLVLDRDFLPTDSALLIPHTPDGRVLFAIPWKGKVLLGTTDTPRTDLPLEPRPLAGEIDFILETAGRYLARPPRREDVRSAFAGLRPLIGSGQDGAKGGTTAALSREHLIQVSRQGLVSVARENGPPTGAWASRSSIPPSPLAGCRRGRAAPAHCSFTATRGQAARMSSAPTEPRWTTCPAPESRSTRPSPSPKPKSATPSATSWPAASKTSSPAVTAPCSSTPAAPALPPRPWPPSWRRNWASTRIRRGNRRKPSSNLRAVS